MSRAETDQTEEIGGYHRGENLIAKYYNAIASLPKPPETVSYGEVHPELFRRIRTMSRAGLVEIEEDTEEQYNKYRLREPVHEAFREHNPGMPMPCGHSGMTNIGGGQIGCTAGWCQKTVDRETLKEEI